MHVKTHWIQDILKRRGTSQSSSEGYGGTRFVVNFTHEKWQIFIIKKKKCQPPVPSPGSANGVHFYVLFRKSCRPHGKSSFVIRLLHHLWEKKDNVWKWYFARKATICYFCRNLPLHKFSNKDIGVQPLESPSSFEMTQLWDEKSVINSVVLTHNSQQRPKHMDTIWKHKSPKLAYFFKWSNPGM